MPGGGDFVSFFRPWGRSFALKSCPGVGILTEKINGPGGMVTGQIDTCISYQYYAISYNIDKDNIDKDNHCRHHF